MLVPICIFFSHLFSYSSHLLLPAFSCLKNITVPCRFNRKDSEKKNFFFFYSNFDKMYSMLGEIPRKPVVPMQCFYCMLLMTLAMEIKYFSLAISVLIMVLLTSSWPLLFFISVANIVSFPLVPTEKRIWFCNDCYLKHELQNHNLDV